MSRSKKSIKNMLTATIGQGFGIIISFISRIFFIRILGSEYLGLNGLFTNILTILSLAELGIGEAIVFSLYKPLAEKNIEKEKMLMQFYKKVYSIIGITIIFIGIIITPFINVFIKDMPNISNIYLIYILFVVNTGCSYFFSYKRNLIIADQNRYIVTIYRYVFYFLLNLFQIIFLIIKKDYILYLVLQIVFTLIENFFISIKANKLYPYLNEKDKISLDVETRNDIMKNTKAMMMHKVGGVVVKSTDNLLLSSFVSLRSVALYSNYYMIINALDTIFSQVFNSLSASIGNLFVTENVEKKYDIFKKIYFINYIIYSFATVSLVCLFNPFIEIWIGKEYLFSLDIVLIIVVNFYITGMRKTVLMFREVSGLFYKDRWKAIIEAFVNIVFSIILALRLGTFGVFLGTFISSITVCVWVESYILYRYAFKQKVRLFWNIYLKYLIFTILLSFIAYMICSLIKGNIYFVFIIRVCISIIIPNLMNLLLFYRSSEFKYFYNKLLKTRS